MTGHDPNGNDRYILLVEDSPDDEELTRLAFAKGNVLNRLEVARDGPEALAFVFGAAESGEPLPAVILLDLKLPKIDGLEVLQRIREHPKAALIPVVILTGSKEDEDRLAAYRLGGNAYLRKPVKMASFIEVARTLGMFWLLLNEPPPEISQVPETGSSRSATDAGNGLRT